MRRSSLDLSGLSRAHEEPLGSPSPASPIDRPEMVLSLAEAVEADEELDTVSDGPGAPRIYTPPPHIAARFYRPSQARRKDSAASSRRNSISSAHSLSSAGCARQAGPQSKHIAQHLRRASILEDRKARLADRAAHAEKVRLRAALAKATIRDTSASEERALAAQQTRERNLAEIAAACAEEVKRAKAVAESTKEKREQEIRKLKMQMEERMAEVQRRRDELMSRNAAKTRSRGHSQSLGNIRKAADMLSDVKEESKEADRPMTPESAARQLQWWWRATARRRAVAEFQALGLNIDGVRETAFEKVVQLLAQESVLTATSRMLRICGLREGTVGSVNEMAAVRTFLSALLILGHPAQVLSNKDNKGEQEQVGAALAHPLSKDDLANPQLQELVGKARDLLICFENILPRLTSMNGYTPPPSLEAQLPETYAAFHNTFISWKARDSGALIDVMLMQFIELDAIWQTVKDSTDPSVTESYRQSIQDNQVMLLVRIKKLAGAEQGKKMVFEAVRKARKSRAEIKPSGDTKPREAADYTVETAMGDLGTPESLEQRDEDLTDQEPSPSKQAKHMTVRVRIPRNRLLPDNRILVHELSIDKNYRLSAEEYREQQAIFLAPLLQRMRDTMQHESQEEEHFRLLLEVAKELRGKLQRLVQQGKSMHTFIGEVLDTEVAYQQFVTGSFSYEKFFVTMGQLLPKLCAPVRDDEVRELVENGLQNGTYVDRLEALMSFIDIMSSDHANYLLSLVAPQILSSASQYESKCFAQALERKEHGLETAEASWRSARGRLVAEATRRDPEGISQPKSRPTPDRIYTQVLVDLFTRLGPISLDDIPETLRLDHRRAVRSGALTRRIVTTGAILLQCKNMLKRDVRVPWRTEASRIMTVLEAADERWLLKQKEGEDSSPAHGSESSSQAVVDGVMAALESGRSMPSATKANLRALVGKMEAAAAESGRTGSEPSEPVLRLLLGRLRTHVLSRLAAGSASEKVRTASTAGERLAGLGLAEFVDRVRDMVDEISRVGAVDREAHGPWWEAVAETVDKEEDQEGSEGASSPSAVASSSSN